MTKKDALEHAEVWSKAGGYLNMLPHELEMPAQTAHPLTAASILALAVARFYTELGERK